MDTSHFDVKKPAPRSPFVPSEKNLASYANLLTRFLTNKAATMPHQRNMRHFTRLTRSRLLLAAAVCTTFATFATCATSALAAPFAYLTAQKDNAVVVIDLATQARVATIAVGKAPVGIAVVDATARAYVTNADDGTVSVIDTAARRVIGLLHVTGGARTIYIDALRAADEGDFGPLVRFIRS